MEIQDGIHIGHSDDALALLDQVLEETDFDPESVRAVLEALKDAIERGII
jgi:uncharacterized protein (DUF2267 family)